MTSEEIYKMADSLKELAICIEKEECRIDDIRWDLTFRNWMYYDSEQKAELVAKLHRSIQIKEAAIERLKKRVNKIITQN